MLVSVQYAILHSKKPLFWFPSVYGVWTFSLHVPYKECGEYKVRLLVDQLTGSTNSTNAGHQFLIRNAGNPKVPFIIKPRSI